MESLEEFVAITDILSKFNFFSRIDRPSDTHIISLSFLFSVCQPLIIFLCWNGTFPIRLSMKLFDKVKDS